MRIRKTIVLAGVIGLSGCASQDGMRADAGSPYPAWCADAARQLREAQLPGSPAPSAESLPRECREGASGIRIFGTPTSG